VKIKSQKDFWSGLMFVVTGLGFAWGATFYSFGTSARPGPGYFPLGLGLILAGLGALTLFESMTIETDDGEPVGAFAWKPLITILFAVLMFGILLPRLGMALTIPLLVVVASLAGDQFSWRGAVINSVVLAIGSWAIFILGLKLVIPLWPPFLAN
jgi:Tripartite tricarboxylate transporter TctB family